LKKLDGDQQNPATDLVETTLRSAST